MRMMKSMAFSVDDDWMKVGGDRHAFPGNVESHHLRTLSRVPRLGREVNFVELGIGSGECGSVAYTEEGRSIGQAVDEGDFGDGDVDGTGITGLSCPGLRREGREKKYVSNEQDKTKTGEIIHE
jgi:hypothetical protein